MISATLRQWPDRARVKACSIADDFVISRLYGRPAIETSACFSIPAQGTLAATVTAVDLPCCGPEGDMSDFEGLFALFGLMFGLIIAELSLKMADAIDSHRERPIGVLTPVLAGLVLTDVTSFWLFVWAARNALHINWHTVFAGVLIAMIYFLSASLVFPRTRRDWRHLDDHYWARKRVVVGGILFANVAMDSFMLSWALPEWNDWMFYFYFPLYVAALIGLVFSRSRRLDLLCFAVAIGINLASGSDLVPGSRWGQQVGLTFGAPVAQPLSPYM
jgi:hypothetical protein